jgi:hypothetical protein
MGAGGEDPRLRKGYGGRQDADLIGEAVAEHLVPPPAHEPKVVGRRTQGLLRSYADERSN